MLRFVLAGTIAVWATASAAHFQTIYTPNAFVPAPGTIPVGLILWHPWIGDGSILEMPKPRQFYMVHRGQEIDLLPSLKATTFTTTVNKATVYEADVPVQTPGDYAFAVVPEPFFSESDDLYIQQLAKAYVNRGGLARSEWTRPVGLDTEIIPMVTPYNVLVGSTFTGLLISEGEPVPGARVDIQHIAFTPDLAADRIGPRTMPAPAAGYITVFTDPNGYFTVGVPKAGWWGFAALGVGPASEYKGKPMSQDAAIWVYAHD